MKIRKNRRKSQFRYSEKGALKLRRAATTKPKQIEGSGPFLFICNFALFHCFKHVENQALFGGNHEL